MKVPKPGGCGYDDVVDDELPHDGLHRRRGIHDHGANIASEGALPKLDPLGALEDGLSVMRVDGHESYSFSRS
jgi:hypothetical protein